MTAQYLGHWLDDGNHYRMQLLGDAADNPDQRIADDIRLFIELTLFIGVGLLGAVVSFFSFVVILWSLSAGPLILFGIDWAIPGYLVWVAVIYSIAGTWITHLIGRPLIALNFNQQRYEADFRFNLIRVRENSEQIALLDGEKAEGGRLLDRFNAVVNNWFAIMTRQKKLSFFTNGFGQVSSIFPIVVISPAYFAGHIQLGGLTQTASAFGSVQQALSFFVDTYVRFAEWRAVIERLDGFERATVMARAVARTAPAIAIEARGDTAAIRLDDLDVRLPQGTRLVAADGIAIAPHDNVLVTGTSGSGKSTLFRAIAGIWPFGSGVVQAPADKRVMALPQRPYFPIGRLDAAISYPAVPGSFDPARIRELITEVGLPALAERLAEGAHWNRMLSLGEQQRLGIVRAILHAPDFLLLDEATASLDEPSEAALYRLIRERLPTATIVSIGHRSTLRPFHSRHLALVRDGDHHRVQDVALATAAQ
jgi:putative ATP-binding cassette transporter